MSLTAWQALVDTADVRPGQRVLVHGAAGGVGHVAVQIAVARGAIVVGTASAHNHDLVRTLGASEVIDYTTTDFAEAARDIDIVIDTVGHDYPQRSLLTMRAGGTVVSLALSSTQPLGAAAKVRGVRHELLLVESDHAGMHGIAELVSAGTLRPHIAATYPLRDAAVGHLQGETGHVAGKIVLTL